MMTSCIVCVRCNTAVVGLIQFLHGSRVATFRKFFQDVLRVARVTLRRPGGCCALSCCSPCICFAGTAMFLVTLFTTLLNSFVFAGTLVATVYMLKSSCDAQSAFLNGLAVAFVTQVDNLMRDFVQRLVDPARLTEDEKMYESSDDEGTDAEAGSGSKEQRVVITTLQTRGISEEVEVRERKPVKLGITLAGVVMFRAFLVAYIVFVVVSGFLIFAL